MASEGSDYKLIAGSSSVDLSRHVNEKVQVTGTWASAGSSMGSSSAAEPSSSTGSSSTGSSTGSTGSTYGGGSSTGSSYGAGQSSSNMSSFTVSSVKTIASSCR